MRGEGERMRERKKGEREPRDCFPNLYVLTKTTYSLKLAKASSISRRRSLGQDVFTYPVWGFVCVCNRESECGMTLCLECVLVYVYENACCVQIDCNWFVFLNSVHSVWRLGNGV